MDECRKMPLDWPPLAMSNTLKEVKDLASHNGTVKEIRERLKSIEKTAKEALKADEHGEGLRF